MLKDFSWCVYNQIFDEIYEFQFNPYYFRLISILEDTNISMFYMIRNYILIVDADELSVGKINIVEYLNYSFDLLECS